MRHIVAALSLSLFSPFVLSAPVLDSDLAGSSDNDRFYSPDNAMNAVLIEGEVSYESITIGENTEESIDADYFTVGLDSVTTGMANKMRLWLLAQLDERCVSVSFFEPVEMKPRKVYLAPRGFRAWRDDRHDGALSFLPLFSSSYLMRVAPTGECSGVFKYRIHIDKSLDALEPYLATDHENSMS